MTDKNNTLTYRVSQLENAVEKLDKKIDKLLTNDIPHIDKELATLKTRMTILTAVNGGTIITAILVSKFL